VRIAAQGQDNLNSSKNEMGEPQLQDQRRTEKRLARGLEEVSHLFLSQTAPSPAERETPGGLPRESSELANGKEPVLLHVSQAISSELLISTLHRNAAVLEEGMHAIDRDIPCDPFGPIDILALDSLDQLVIIDIATELQDSLLLRGIAQFDWFERNTSILRRMYQGRVVNFSARPRLFLVAPAFSQLLKRAAEQSTCSPVVCFSFRTVALPGGVGVLFEKIVDSR
jgi:hypothetical protein